MTGATVRIKRPQTAPVPERRQARLHRFTLWLRRYYPRFGDKHFWAVQGLILAIALLHAAIDSFGVLQEYEGVEFMPISLFLVPLIYAALNFGFVGSVATAVWVALISIPIVVFLHTGLGRVGEIFQLAVIVSVAIIAGHRVDRESRARQQAETAGIAWRNSEARYRSLFQSSPVPIVLFDGWGKIIEANPAAAVLFGRHSGAIAGSSLAGLIGTANAEALLATAPRDSWRDTSFTFRRDNGPNQYLEPTKTTVKDAEGNIVVQALLRDVTHERQRQAGLRAFAGHILHAQEEERQFIARELHDETVQTLALLCRRLDEIGAGGQYTVPAPVTAELAEARKSVEDIVKGLRDFARALRPPILEDLGLVASVRRLLADLTERTKMQSQLRLEGVETRLHPDVELALFRIAQETLRNVERHSRASRVSVTLTFAATGFKLEIEDDGIGFVVPASFAELSTAGHLGLLGLQERTRLLDGILDVRSKPGGGARVRVSIPAETAPVRV